ncbi:beach domain-containing protein [Anaeramoeba flamelloides]|uniref:Beach domain-containing protein n=1 Tax=Anaeramoeba flamelloides TaxID=1746091 RepID=A0ABQ8YYW2_9EUKA|nr:beach domain-containing protein [Anaeramoeba flamelloides]
MFFNDIHNFFSLFGKSNKGNNNLLYKCLYNLINLNLNPNHYFIFNSSNQRKPSIKINKITYNLKNGTSYSLWFKFNDFRQIPIKEKENKHNDNFKNNSNHNNDDKNNNNDKLNKNNNNDSNENKNKNSTDKNNNSTNKTNYNAKIHLFSKNLENEKRIFSLYLINNKLNYYCNEKNNYCFNKFQFNNNNWYHILIHENFVKNELNSLTLFVNGELIEKIKVQNNNLNYQDLNNFKFHFGYLNFQRGKETTNNITWFLSNFYFFNTELTKEIILQIYLLGNNYYGSFNNLEKKNLLYYLKLNNLNIKNFYLKLTKFQIDFKKNDFKKINLIFNQTTENLKQISKSKLILGLSPLNNQNISISNRNKKIEIQFKDLKIYQKTGFKDQLLKNDYFIYFLTLIDNCNNSLNFLYLLKTLFYLINDNSNNNDNNHSNNKYLENNQFNLIQLLNYFLKIKSNLINKEIINVLFQFLGMDQTEIRYSLFLKINFLNEIILDREIWKNLNENLQELIYQNLIYFIQFNYWAEINYNELTKVDFLKKLLLIFREKNLNIKFVLKILNIINCILNSKTLFNEKTDLILLVEMTTYLINLKKTKRQTDEFNKNEKYNFFQVKPNKDIHLLSEEGLNSKNPMIIKIINSLLILIHKIIDKKFPINFFQLFNNDLIANLLNNNLHHTTTTNILNIICYLIKNKNINNNNNLNLDININKNKNNNVINQKNYHFFYLLNNHLMNCDYQMDIFITLFRLLFQKTIDPYSKIHLKANLLSKFKNELMIKEKINHINLLSFSYIINLLKLTHKKYLFNLINNNFIHNKDKDNDNDNDNTTNEDDDDKKNNNNDNNKNDIDDEEENNKQMIDLTKWEICFKEIYRNFYHNF